MRLKNRIWKNKNLDRWKIYVLCWISRRPARFVLWGLWRCCRDQREWKYSPNWNCFMGKRKVFIIDNYIIIKFSIFVKIIFFQIFETYWRMCKKEQTRSIRKASKFNRLDYFGIKQITTRLYIGFDKDRVSIIYFPLSDRCIFFSDCSFFWKNYLLKFQELGFALNLADRI